MADGSPDLNAIIDEHLAAFDKPGVLSVRPGFKVTNAWLTDRRCIVVTVRRKLARPPEGQALPRDIAGVPVDVRQASPEKRMEIEDPQRYAAELRLAPDAGSVPHFAHERTLTGARPAAAASAHAELARIEKPKLAYNGPAGVALEPIEAPATIHLSASPDAGWGMLKQFLVGTSASLTVGLYDFTSAHILSVAEEHLAGKRFELVLDDPPENAEADQTDADTVADLRQALGGALDQAWALTKLDGQATAWIYPTAYHIKVAVRDNSVFWLSSGNWNNANQPDIDPISDPADAPAARHYDRDWHVVVEQPQLARLFEAYILNDLAIAAAHNAIAAPRRPRLPPARAGSAKTPAFNQFFPADTVSGRIKITPLLTPDPGVYASAVNELSARLRRRSTCSFSTSNFRKRRTRHRRVSSTWCKRSLTGRTATLT